MWEDNIICILPEQERRHLRTQALEGKIMNKTGFKASQHLLGSTFNIKTFTALGEPGLQQF